MADKTDEQIAKEREAVEAMRNAKANMTGALDRILTLERALEAAITGLTRAKGYVASTVYTYPANGTRERTVHAELDAYIADARAKLGAGL